MKKARYGKGNINILLYITMSIYIVIVKTARWFKGIITYFRGWWEGWCVHTGGGRGSNLQLPSKKLKKN